MVKRQGQPVAEVDAEGSYRDHDERWMWLRDPQSFTTGLNLVGSLVRSMGPLLLRIRPGNPTCTMRPVHRRASLLFQRFELIAAQGRTHGAMRTFPLELGQVVHADDDRTHGVAQSVSAWPPSCRDGAEYHARKASMRTAASSGVL